MKSIAVLGLGNFGTSLARNWIVAGHDVRGWTVEQEVFNSISASRVNKKYLRDVSLDGIRVSMDIAETIAGAEIVVLALPSGVILNVVDDIMPYLTDEQILLDLAKGLAPGDQMISEVIASKLDTAGLSCKLCVMMGPTIALEVSRGVYTTALLTSNEVVLAQQVASALTTSTLKLSAGTDLVGSEYWGAFKNVVALACGVVDGVKQDGRGGDNLKAAVFTSGYREAATVLPQMGADPETALSVAGIGDLFVTATSLHGRNREMGERLGRGQSLAEAEADMVMVSEGVRAARMFKNLFSSKGVDAPFVGAVCALLDGDVSIDEFLDKVMG